MAQVYSDPSRENDPYALPDVEVFWHDGNRDGGPYREGADGDSEPMEAGWYWWACFPGCMPDGDPVGPFDSERAALEDAQNGEG